MQEEESAHTDDLASYDWDGERDLIDISSTEVNEILASVRYFRLAEKTLTRDEHVVGLWRREKTEAHQEWNGQLHFGNHHYE